MQDLGSDAASLVRALEDAKAFNKGKGRALLVMLAFGVFTIGGLAWYVLHEQPSPYRVLGKQTNGLKTLHFDTFWACALPGKVVSEVKSDADLRGEIEVRAVGGRRYARLLQTCLQHIEILDSQLRALLPPSDAVEHVQRMAKGAESVRSGAQYFVQSLASMEGEYEAICSLRDCDVMVRGWYEFRKAHADLNVVLRAQLGK